MMISRPSSCLTFSPRPPNPWTHYPQDPLTHTAPQFLGTRTSQGLWFRQGLSDVLPGLGGISLLGLCWDLTQFFVWRITKALAEDLEEAKHHLAYLPPSRSRQGLQARKTHVRETPAFNIFRPIHPLASKALVLS